MGQAYEVLRDPSDRYVLWDLANHAPVLAADRIASFATSGDTRRFLAALKHESFEVVAADGAPVSVDER